MSKRHANIEGIEWKQMDVRRMENLSSESIDVAFDKGTLDAMIHGSPWSPPDDVLENTGQYIRETFRVLKSDGIFLYVTYRQPHFVKPLLSPEGTTWDINVEVLGGSGSTFQYHAFTLKKAAKT
ncbi:putative methyltransferase type 11 protein [Eutypa lata UCREL1]|uniref:Putative methyltransferase type 11 protein n=1 Tax=Eutypa lata (strain UCR-EL1) TaxID=1287681 RepID=M7SWE3_EUTLA|nr:putative methyltransferase type 11 protein [Eutypa lata UCREL1]